MAKGKVLFVLSSCSSFQRNGEDHPTGWFLPEFSHPYNQLTPQFDIVVASPKGGEAPLDPSSVEFAKDDQESIAFHKEKSALWKNTEKLSSFVGKASDFAAIFYVGGHGPMFDLGDDATSQQIIREFWESGKVVSAVCHGPVALAKVKLSDGSYLIKDSAVTGFSDIEEEKMGFTGDMPYSLEGVLGQNGGKFEAAEPFGEKIVVGKEGRLITGQNPASAAGTGKAVAQAVGA